MEDYKSAEFMLGQFEIVNCKFEILKVNYIIDYNSQ